MYVLFISSIVVCHNEIQLINWITDPLYITCATPFVPIFLNSNHQDVILEFISLTNSLTKKAISFSYEISPLQFKV